MPCYLYQASYSGAAIKTLVANPQDRTGPAKAAIEANGGTMIGAWMAFGSDDLVVVADCPMTLLWRALRWRSVRRAQFRGERRLSFSICPRP